jgi:hypothetical protein
LERRERAQLQPRIEPAQVNLASILERDRFLQLDGVIRTTREVFAA